MSVCVAGGTQGSFPWVSGLVQEKINSSALAMELRLSCTNPPILCIHPANETQRYNVMFLIGWVQNDPYVQID